MCNTYLHDADYVIQTRIYDAADDLLYRCVSCQKEVRPVSHPSSPELLWVTAREESNY